MTKYGVYCTLHTRHHTTPHHTSASAFASSMHEQHAWAPHNLHACVQCAHSAACRHPHRVCFSKQQYKNCPSLHNATQSSSGNHAITQAITKTIIMNTAIQTVLTRPSITRSDPVSGAYALALRCPAIACHVYTMPTLLHRASCWLGCWILAKQNRSRSASHQQLQRINKPRYCAPIYRKVSVASTRAAYRAVAGASPI